MLKFLKNVMLLAVAITTLLSVYIWATEGANAGVSYVRKASQFETTVLLIMLASIGFAVEKIGIAEWSKNEKSGLIKVFVALVLGILFAGIVQAIASFEMLVASSALELAQKEWGLIRQLSWTGWISTGKMLWDELGTVIVVLQQSIVLLVMLLLFPTWMFSWSSQMAGRRTMSWMLVGASVLWLFYGITWIGAVLSGVPLPSVDSNMRAHIFFGAVVEGTMLLAGVVAVISGLISGRRMARNSNYS